MCGSIEVDVWRARIGLFTARIASRLPKRWRKIKKQVVSMLFTHGVFAGGGACSFGCVSNFRHRRETRLLAVLMSLLLAVSVMNVSLLLRCGDIETNPGPGRYPDLDYDSVDCSKSLGEDDLHDIMSEVITAKARFYAIGRALGLPPGELSSIRSSSTQDHELQLNDVLLVWLRQKYNVERFGFPTWRKLVEVIDNPVGGNDHKLAKIIASHHPVVKVSMNEIGYVCGHGRERGHGRGQGHGYDHGAQEHGQGRGVGSKQVGSALQHHQKEPPKNESKFLYRQTLNTFYLRQIDDQAWPPVKVTNFINLALIKDLTSWRETVQGSVDEVVGEKENIMYQQIFDNLAQLKFVLFEGRPGSGKTTLMNKISRDWANGLFLQSKMLFFIPLRRLNTFDERTLATLIQVACPPFKQDEVESLVGAVQVMDGKNVIFIFDGFDEYSPAYNSSNDIVMSLMNSYRSYLRDALIVVSSRPAACYKYRRYADKQIEVVGFLKEHISQYIRHYYDKDVEKAQQLLGHLELHPNLMNMCYLPLHCAMLVFLYDGTAILPKTETEFYKHFTISTLLRSYCKLKDNVICLTSFDQIPPKDKILFGRVCKLAFEATVARKQVFRFSELQEISLDLESGSNESYLGLVVIDRCFMRFGLDETYTFLHLTFQEYLAAIYLAGLNHSELYTIVERQYNNMSVVYRFLCGMLNFRTSIGFKIFNRMRLSTTSTLTMIQWIYESQSQLLYKYITNNWKGTLEFDFPAYWTMSDGPAIASFLNNRMIYRVNFRGVASRLSKDAVDAVFSCVDNKRLRVDIKIDPERIKRFEGSSEELIAKFCENRVGFLSLYYTIYPWIEFSYEMVKSCLKYPGFEFVIQRWNPQQKSDGKGVVEYFRECSNNLENLRPLKVFDGLIIVMLSGLKCYCIFSCDGLHIPGCRILKSHFLPEDYATCLSDVIPQYIYDIQKIRTYGLKISEDSMLKLIESFEYCTNLSFLDLGGMELKICGARALGQCLTNYLCKNIQVLMVDDNEFGDAGLQALMPGIQSCALLQELILHGNQLTDDSVLHLINMIRTNKNLTRLGYYSNAFTQVGESKLKEAAVEAGLG